MGKDGARTVIVNSVGREMGELERTEPIEGRRLKLTIDYDVQKAIEDGFNASRLQRRRRGARPADRRSARLHAAVPAYDPNAFAAGIDRATWASLNTDDLRPLQNRAIQGRYSPGSTFKMAVALAALEEGVITPDFKVHCAGGANFYGRYFKCWKKGGHGTVDLRHAIEQSCDVFFYTVGNMLGVDRIHKWATLLGLGVMSGIDLPNEVAGLVPSTAWKKQRDRGEVVRGRDDLGVHRPGPGVGDAGLDGRLHGDAGQRRRARHAAPVKAEDDGNGLGAGAARRRRSRRSTMEPREAAGASATASGWSSTPAARAARPASPGEDVCGQDRARRRSSRTRAARRRRAAARTCATTAGSSSSRRATTRGSPASSSSSTASTAATRRRVAHHILDDVLREGGRPAAAAAAHARGAAPRLTRIRWRSIAPRRLEGS